MIRTFSHWVVKRVITNYNHTSDPYVRSEYGTLQGSVSLLLNLFLFVFKMGVGTWVNSMAVIADAIHTLSDSTTSLIVIISFKISKKPSDKEHPFGHGQIEPIATLIIAVILFMVGFELAQNSLDRIFDPRILSVPWWVILLIILTIGVKEIMARFSWHLGDFIQSSTLKADAMHHRSDALSTILVVVALICSRFGFGWIDGVMGLFVSLSICYFAYKIARDAINPLLGEAPSEKTLKEIECIAMKFPGVNGVHDIIFHQYGQTKIISLHIEVSDKENVNRLHALSEDVEESIAHKMESVVVVHIDPINKDHPKYNEIEAFIQKMVTDDKRIKNFHELRIIGADSEKCSVVFDISLTQEVEDAQKYKVVKDIYSCFKRKYPRMKICVKVEPRFVYSNNPK